MTSTGVLCSSCVHVRCGATHPTRYQAERSGRLLALIHRLVDYAKELAVTVRERVAVDPIFAKTCFGTVDLSVILRRIACGLMLANALEARVLRHAARLDKGPGPWRWQSERKPSVPRPAEPTDGRLALVPGLDPGSPPTADLPTPEQIAAEIRRRPIGAVIADICRNLGILPSHPLWREVRGAIGRHGGNCARLVLDLLDLVFPLDPELLAPALRPALRGCGPRFQTPSGTGPP